MSSQTANGPIAVALTAVLITGSALQVAHKAQSKPVETRPVEPTHSTSTGEYVSPFVQVPYKPDPRNRHALPTIGFHYNPSTEYAYFRGLPITNPNRWVPKPILTVSKMKERLAERPASVMHFDGVRIEADAMRYIVENHAVTEFSFRQCTISKQAIGAMAGCKHLTDLFTFVSLPKGVDATAFCKIKSLRKVQLLENTAVTNSLPYLHNCLPDAVITR